MEKDGVDERTSDTDVSRDLHFGRRHLPTLTCNCIVALWMYFTRVTEHLLIRFQTQSI